MSPKFEVGDKVGHVHCPGAFFVSFRKSYDGAYWVYNLRVTMAEFEPLEKYWVYESGLGDPGIIEDGRITKEAYGICECLEDNLYAWTMDQSWDKEAV